MSLAFVCLAQTKTKISARVAAHNYATFPALPKPFYLKHYFNRLRPGKKGVNMRRADASRLIF
jgi:hypothetical protein